MIIKYINDHIFIFIIPAMIKTKIIISSKIYLIENIIFFICFFLFWFILYKLNILITPDKSSIIFFPISSLKEPEIMTDCRLF